MALVEEPSFDEESGEEEPFIFLENIHKTYLLGVEGVAALRFVFFF